MAIHLAVSSLLWLHLFMNKHTHTWSAFNPKEHPLQFQGKCASRLSPVYIAREEMKLANLFVLSFLGLPDPFAKISVDGSGQCHSTEACKATLDPKWNQHYDL